jgi:hypothetical protein
MDKFKKYRIYLIVILIFILILFNVGINIQYICLNEPSQAISKFEENEISFVVNLNNLTKKKHCFFYEIIKKLNLKRNYYFVKIFEKTLNENLFKIVENTPIKIVESNFPDSIFLPLVVSLYGIIQPKFVLFIEGEDLLFNSGKYLTEWIIDSYDKIIKNNYDYIFGGFQFIDGKKIGCSILLSKASIIEHLLYYTDSDTTHVNPFIQLSFATKTKFCVVPFNFLKPMKLDINHQRFSSNMKCPSINDKEIPSLCIMLPNFKRNYFSYSFSAFSNQTFKPKFYLIIQNENRINYNLLLIQKFVNEPIYHIWMQNWNPFFFLNHRLSSVLPCDFVMKYDDDQWPIDNNIQQNLMKAVKNKNIIIGYRGYSVQKSFCGYSPVNYTKTENDVVDHSAVPLLIRPGYIKLDARNYIYRLFGGEDISLSLNSRKLCNVTSKTMQMTLMELQKDGNNQRADKQIILAYKNEKEKQFNLFGNIYCYLIRSGYKPRRWEGFQIPPKDYLNITIEHKSIN